MKWLFLLLFAYLLGSVPTGLLVCRLLGLEDPRRAGSRNIGATNVGRTAGRLPGILTLAGDVLKGLLPTLWAVAALRSPLAMALVGLAAYLGHLFPLYLGFRGGKGVATALGVFLALSPGAIVLAALVFALVLGKWRMVSLASLAAAAALPLFCGFVGEPRSVTLLAVVILAFTGWRHRENIDRILSGTENRLGGEGSCRSNPC
jgi:acyl phosphate:glycerol-3-phosphate acyltransferase